MLNSNQNIAIIGAGLAGSVLADRLQQAGHNVTVYDKSRGTGGRISACRTQSGSADLGAPFFPAPETSEHFQQWLQQRQGLDLWQANCMDFSGEKHPDYVCFSMSPRQNSLCRNLIENCTFIPQARVGLIWPETEAETDVVVVRDDRGQRLASYDTLIVATPAQQAAPILEAIPRFANRAQQTDYDSCWISVIEIADKLETDAELILGEHPVLKRCTKDSAKPGRSGNSDRVTWVLEANPIWSKANLAAEPTDVEKILLEAFKSCLTECSSHVKLSPTFSRTHRWLYSRHQANRSADSFLWDENCQIGVCGDWLASGDLEGAWQSATDLADHLIGTN